MLGANVARRREVLVDFWAQYGFLWRPVVAFAVVAVLILLLRWTMSRGHSLVTGPGRRGAADEYGLLVAVAEPATAAEAELLAARLRAAGLRATVAPTVQGPRVMVFETDRARAEAVLSAPP